jgi:hypothetical protein
MSLLLRAADARLPLLSRAADARRQETRAALCDVMFELHVKRPADPADFLRTDFV